MDYILYNTNSVIGESSLFFQLIIGRLPFNNLKFDTLKVH
jgi:hypothetical protein